MRTLVSVMENGEVGVRTRDRPPVPPSAQVLATGFLSGRLGLALGQLTFSVSVLTFWFFIFLT